METASDIAAIRCASCGQRIINGRCLACDHQLAAARRLAAPEDPVRWLAWRVANGQPISREIARERFGAAGEAALEGDWAALVGQYGDGGS